MVDTLGTIMNEELIYGLSIGNNMGGNMRGLNPLQFVLLDQLLEGLGFTRRNIDMDETN